MVCIIGFSRKFVPFIGNTHNWSAWICFWNYSWLYLCVVSQPHLTDQMAGPMIARMRMHIENILQGLEVNFEICKI